ncbi:MAG: VIT1/CCC1 transporter family protein [Deltaproteobacteria bacterium]|nr:VIT1/CCC1 transporter family protein [Deltaproteobacteria bacterium]
MAALDTAAQRHHHDRHDPHVRGRWLSDVVLGAQDGLVNTLGVVLGVAAASGSSKVVVAAGAAAALAEALSMGAVGYSSSAARGDLFRSEREREYRHVDLAPDVEREEVRRMYAAKGFEGELLDRVVETICANRDVWVAVMMAEEHELTPVDRAASLRSASIVGFGALLASIPAILPFAFAPARLGSGLAIAGAAALLFALGAFKARITVGTVVRSGLELVAIGLFSAAAAWGVGAILAPTP